MRPSGLVLLLFATAALLLLLGVWHLETLDDPENDPQGTSTLHWEMAHHDFEGFDNESGSPLPIVPNIIHFLRFNQTEIKFVDAVCILAAVRNHKPDHLYIHTDASNFTGKYWHYLLNASDFNKIYKIKKITLPNTIFGQNISSWWHYQHGSDVTRIRILMQYGGIFLDNDSYVVNRLDKYRRFEMAIGWDQDQFLGCQVVVAHPDARFLKLWLESYRGHYRPDEWYYNAGERPTASVLAARPQLVHRVRILFGVHFLADMLYKNYMLEWRYHDAIHLLINHRYYADKENYQLYPEFNDINILNYNFTFGYMARDVYFRK